MISVITKIYNVIELFGKGFDYIFSFDMLQKIISIFIPPDIDYNHNSQPIMEQFQNKEEDDIIEDK